MNIPQEDKDKLLALKKKYDNYYRIELKVADNVYDLLNLSDSDKKELEKSYPQILDFVAKEKENLLSVRKHFSSAEIKKEVLADSGQSSRYGAYALLPVLFVQQEKLQKIK